jgi:SAM-dependent methyltransferase
MTQGPFNTDTKALERRIQAHEQFGANDVNAWIFQCLSLAAGSAVLDLGCGTGKQALPMARTVGGSGSVVAVDASADAVQAVEFAAQNEGLFDRISAIQCDLDKVPTALAGRKFDRVVASYSIYYTQRPEELFGFIHESLAPGGIFFACGPSSDNNAELKDFHFGLPGAPEPKGSTAAIFLERTGPDILRRLFGAVETSHFENPLRFDSAEALYTYWSSYNLFDQRLAEAFRARAVQHFETHPTFTTVKRVVGIRAQRAAP